MTDQPDRRHPLRLIVSKKSQLRILWWVGGGIFFCIIAVEAVIFYITSWVWASALAVVIGAFVSLWVSRKIAGPFYRIEKDLEALLSDAAGGHPIRLRPDDPLEHLAALINQLIERKKS